MIEKDDITERVADLTIRFATEDEDAVLAEVLALPPIEILALISGFGLICDLKLRCKLFYAAVRAIDSKGTST